MIHSGSTRKPASPFGRYLIYAIGEIALVVIGILIALQINNWNEYGKEKAAEIELLKSLKNEITTNVDQLKNGIEIHKSSKEKCVKLLQHFLNPNLTIDTDFLDSLVENISYPYAVNLKKGIVKSIIATGDLRFIESEQIVEFITVFEDRIQETTDDFARLNRIYEGQLWPLQHKYIRSMNRLRKRQELIGYKMAESPLSSDYNRFFEDIVLENTFALTLYEQTDFIDGEEVLLGHMEDALKLVHDELASK